MTKTKTAKKTKWATFVDRWHDIQGRRARVDFETAQLANEIRVEFPTGASGDLQFRLWCVQNLEIGGSTYAMLLRAAHVFTLFEEDDWYDFGGWQSLQFLSTLKVNGRRKVINACRERVYELRERGTQRRHIGYTTVRNICYSLGVQQNRVTGRPNRLKVEESLGFCRNWLTMLYEQYQGLPKLPKPVQDALGGTKLSQISEAVAS